MYYMHEQNPCGCHKPSCGTCQSTLKGKTRTRKYADCTINSVPVNAQDDVKIYNDTFATMDTGNGCLIEVYSGLQCDGWGYSHPKNINGWIPTGNTITINEVKVVINADGTCQMFYNYDKDCEQCAREVEGFDKLVNKIKADSAQMVINQANTIKNLQACVDQLKLDLEALQVTVASHTH